MISVTLQWKDNSKNETGFEIQRCQGVGCANFTTLVIVPANTTTYTDTAVLPSTTYSYRVRAIKGKGHSNFSNTLTVTTASGTTPPLVITCPSNIALDTNSTGGRTVNFNLAVASGGVPPYSIVMTPPSGSVFPVGVTTVSARVTDSVGATITCSFTITITFVDVQPPPPPPNLVITCPANISAVATNGNGIVVNYTAPVGSGGTPPYNVVTSPVSGSLFPVGTTQVRCTITDSLGVISTCSFNVTVTLAIPADPTSLTATVNANGTVTLGWSDNAINETGYVIERKLSTSSVFAALITTNANVNAYIDNTASRGLIYNYRVKAINSGGSSGYSNSATASIPPAAPTNLQAFAGNTSITLGWNAVNNVTYTVKRGTVNGGPYGTTVVTGLTSPSYTNTGLTNGTTYYYVVVSVNAAGTSANSNQASATPQAVLPDANIYISPSGSDSNSGLTPSLPVLTFAHAGSLLNSSQTLGVRGGSFNDRILGVNFPSGTPSSPTTIKNYNGEIPYISPLTPAPNTNPGGVWFDANISYFLFDGINVDTTVVKENCVAFPTHNGSDPHHITYQNARIIASEAADGPIGSGVCVSGGHIFINQTGFNTFRGLEISGGGTIAPSGVTPGNYGIYLAGPNNIAEDCEIYNTVLAGLQIYNGGGDPADFNIVRNIRMHDVKKEVPPGNRYAGMVITGSNNLVVNSRVYEMNAAYNGAGAAAYSFYGGGSFNNKVLFCVAANSTGCGGFANNLATGSKVQNCITYQNVFDYILEDFPGQVTQNHNLFGVDPLFVNIASANFHLLTGSPARGIGILDTSGLSATQVAAILTDADGIVRPNGPDAGNYQFV